MTEIMTKFMDLFIRNKAGLYWRSWVCALSHLHRRLVVINISNVIAYFVVWKLLSRQRWSMFHTFVRITASSAPYHYLSQYCSRLLTLRPFHVGNISDFNIGKANVNMTFFAIVLISAFWCVVNIAADVGSISKTCNSAVETTSTLI